MKRLFKKMKYYSPEILMGLGITATILSASTSDTHILRGETEPKWVIYGVLIGLAVAGIGAFLSSVRESVERAKRR